MAYTRIDFQDRSDNFPDQYFVDGTVSQIVKDNREVTVSGTPLNASNLNIMDIGINDAHSDISDLAINKSTATNGQILTSNGNGTSEFTTIEIGKTYRVIESNLGGSVIDDSTIKDFDFFGETSVNKKIEVRNVDGKAFVKTSIDLSDASNFRVILNYDNDEISFVDEGLNIFEKVASSNVSFMISGLGNTLSNAVYDNKSFSFLSQGNNPRSIRFNNDGSKMYVLDKNNSMIYQYSLTTLYDISTASFDNLSFNVGSQNSDPEGITFNKNGTKMYVVTSFSDGLYQYSLSSPFNISTASYDNVSYNIRADTSDVATRSVSFNEEGTIMYILSANRGFIFQFSLSTPFDISTSTVLSNRLTVSNQESDPHSFSISGNGKKLYVVGNSQQIVFEYELSTPFDISTATYNNISFSVSSQESQVRGITFDRSGIKFYIIGESNRRIYQFSSEASKTGSAYIGVKY